MKKQKGLKYIYIFPSDLPCGLFSFGSQQNDKKVVKTKTTQRRYMQGENNPN